VSGLQVIKNKFESLGPLMKRTDISSIRVEAALIFAV
jgi:hypothetical protein